MRKRGAMRVVNVLVFIFCGMPLLSRADEQPPLLNPAPGVVCDAYFCADTEGVPDRLTQKYPGDKQAKMLREAGRFDRRAFTFLNGTHCDTGEKACRQNRYYNADGKPAGAVEVTTTQMLSGRWPPVKVQAPVAGCLLL
ncbi:hypothetical protein F6T93_001518 [Enterobacter hormaechei]|nr:hypothetical protein [Enterobacter hormaechei]